MSPNDKASYFPLVTGRILPLNWTYYSVIRVLMASIV